MKFNITKEDGSKGSSINVDDSVFGIEPNNSVVHQAVVAELANGRQGTHSTKNRSEVRGGGRKPFKQKGRGVARAGSTRSPIWKGGGTVFGPEPHEYDKKISKTIISPLFALLDKTDRRAILRIVLEIFLSYS
jgi:large subunit ribosomal protein L4